MEREVISFETAAQIGYDLVDWTRYKLPTIGGDGWTPAPKLPVERQLYPCTPAQFKKRVLYTWEFGQGLYLTPESGTVLPAYLDDDFVRLYVQTDARSSVLFVTAVAAPGGCELVLDLNGMTESTKAQLQELWRDLLAFLGFQEAATVAVAAPIPGVDMPACKKPLERYHFQVRAVMQENPRATVETIARDLHLGVDRVQTLIDDLDEADGREKLEERDVRVWEAKIKRPMASHKEIADRINEARYSETSVKRSCDKLTRYGAAVFLRETG